MQLSLLGAIAARRKPSASKTNRLTLEGSSEVTGWNQGGVSAGRKAGGQGVTVGLGLVEEDSLGSYREMQRCRMKMRNMEMRPTRWHPQLAWQ